MNLQIVTQHGESRSFFYVVNADAPDSEQPAVLATFDTRAAAEQEIENLNFVPLCETCSLSSCRPETQTHR